MNDTDWWVREQSIDAIGQIKDKRAIPYVIEILQRHHEQRLMCIQALGALEAGEAAPYIAPFVVDDDPDVRLAAVHCLATVDARDQAGALAQLESDPVFRVRSAARELLSRWNMTPDGTEEKSMNTPRSPAHRGGGPASRRSHPRRETAAIREAAGKDGGAEQDGAQRRAGARDSLSAPPGEASSRISRLGRDVDFSYEVLSQKPPFPRSRLLAADRDRRRSSGW